MKIWYCRQIDRWSRLAGDFIRWSDRMTPGTDSGSKARNRFSYYAMFLCVVIIFDTYASYFGFRVLPGTVWAAMLCVISAMYFYLTTIGVVRLVSRKFQLDPVRLVRDITISVVLAVLSFSLLYRAIGIEPTFCGSADCPVSPLDHIYFSTVTFSTLGYGDFRPSEGARIWAAAQAMFGNVHLGLIVGAFYLAIQVYQKREVDE